MYVKQEYYDVLNSSRTDSLDTIKKNYKTLCLKFHPDVGGSEEHFKKINIAMDIINEFHNDSDNKESFKDNKTHKKENKTNKQQTNKYTNGNSANNRKHTKNRQKKNEHKCPKCGFHDPDAFNYCINCGHKFDSVDKKLIFLFIIGIILFYGISKILALIFFIWLYKHYK